MTKRFLIVVCLCSALSLGVALPSSAAKKYAPEIKEYLDQVKKDRKAEEENKEKERKADEHRRLRPYQTYDEINQELDKLLEEYPDMLSGGTYGKSVEGRDLRWIRLCTGPGDKPELLISGNIHAQELAAGQMVMAILETLVNDYDDNLEVKHVADSADFYFIPVLNPDNMVKVGRQQSKYGVTGFIRKNKGKVDLNRNFPYPPDGPDKLKDGAGSPKRRAQTHRGPEPLSEPEARALIEFIDRHEFLLSLNYHTSGGMILYVPGTYPDPEADTELMKDMAEAYREKQFDKYVVHPGIDLYPTLGALDDYLYHRYGILSFTVEVGKDNQEQMYRPINGTVSPVFWMYNVEKLEQEKANNVPGAMALIKYAVKVHHQPDLRKWEPPDEQWVGEPAR
jgi:predicted deacylase